MKRILAIALTLIMVIVALTGCHSVPSDNSTQDSETSQNDDTTSIGDQSQGTDPSQNTTSPDTEPSDDSTTSGTDNEEPLFKYDKYMVTADARDSMSDREYSLYCRVIDSILAHDGVVNGFESYEEYETVLRFLFSEFIPVRHIIQSYLQSNEPFLYENGTATFKFVGDKETCSENYAKFENIMNEALALIKEDDSDWERIAKLYLYVSDHMTYGNLYESYGVNADLYACILYKTGMCAEYAYYLNTLANQIGFETIDGRSLGKDGFEGADHCWSIICVDGQWYHFDACWQAPLLSKENMEYFAFSTQVRYDSLANNSPWGETGEVEMFNQHDYTYERSDLPFCENGMSENDRLQLYYAVIDEYSKDLSKDIPEDKIESYIDVAMSKVQDALSDGADVGIKFEIKNGTLNGAVKNLILSYSPQDLNDYPQLEYDGDRCNLAFIVLKHMDKTDLKSMLYFIIKEDIVIGQSVELVIL